MLLSQTAHYALRAVYYLVSSGDSKWHLTKEVAEITKIPAPYLARILSNLAKHGILQSRTGMGGGFSVSEEGFNTSLYDVVAQFDNLEKICNCVFGFSEYCSNDEDSKCILHDKWADLKKQLIETFKNCTLKDLKEQSFCPDWSRIKV